MRLRFFKLIYGAVDKIYIPVIGLFYHLRIAGEGACSDIGPLAGGVCFPELIIFLMRGVTVGIKRPFIVVMRPSKKSNFLTNITQF